MYYTQKFTLFKIATVFAKYLLRPSQNDIWCSDGTSDSSQLFQKNWFVQRKRQMVVYIHWHINIYIYIYIYIYILQRKRGPRPRPVSPIAFEYSCGRPCKRSQKEFKIKTCMYLPLPSISHFRCSGTWVQFFARFTILPASMSPKP